MRAHTCIGTELRRMGAGAADRCEEARRPRTSCGDGMAERVAFNKILSANETDGGVGRANNKAP